MKRTTEIEVCCIVAAICFGVYFGSAWVGLGVFCGLIAVANAKGGRPE